jgi:hypothetical protein
LIYIVLSTTGCILGHYFHTKQVFNGDHVQAVASLLAEGIQAPKILQWLSIIADKRPEDVKRATRMIVHTTDFDDANVPLVASILANVAQVDQVCFAAGKYVAEV